MCRGNCGGKGRGGEVAQLERTDKLLGSGLAKDIVFLDTGPAKLMSPGFDECSKPPSESTR